jgi:hypothetical protein
MAISTKLDKPAHIGSSPPLNVYVGRIWYEINTSNKIINNWFWDGNYWLSVNTFTKDAINLSLGNNNIQSFIVDATGLYNIFLLNLSLCFAYNNDNTATSSNYLVYSLESVPTSITTAIYSSISLQNTPINAFNWQYLSNDINALVTNTKRFNIRSIRFGGGTVRGGAFHGQFSYKFARS